MGLVVSVAMGGFPAFRLVGGASREQISLAAERGNLVRHRYATFAATLRSVFALGNA